MPASDSHYKSIPVIIRIRPILNLDPIKKRIIDNDSETITIINPNLDKLISIEKKQEPPKTFKFNRVYGENTETQEIYDNHCFDIVDNVMKGFNACVLVYGMTGSGKSHTMSKKGGIVLNAFKDLFKLAETSEKKYIIQLSYFQIYNDKITDLLGNKPKLSLNLRVNGEVGGLSSHICKDKAECNVLFELGVSRRNTAKTESNSDSSRSHAIVKISVRAVENDKFLHEGTLYLVDLAGAERLQKSKAEGDRKKETTRINLSMLYLANVITALAAKKKGHVPYHNSPLTRVLRNALGGNSKTIFITNVSSSASFYHETLEALRYAFRVTQIQNTPKINVENKDIIILNLRQEISVLKNQLEELKKMYDDTKNTAKPDIKFEREASMFQGDIENCKLSPEQKKMLELKTLVKVKIDEVEQNEELLKKLIDIIQEPTEEKEISPETVEEIKAKRKIAKKAFKHILTSEFEYTDDEKRLLNLDIDEIEHVDMDLFKQMQKLEDQELILNIFNQQKINMEKLDMEKIDVEQLGNGSDAKCTML